MTNSSLSGWGGARCNAGRRPKERTEEAINAMMRTAKKKAKEYGKTIDEVLIDMVYGHSGGGRRLSAANRLSAIKVYKEYTMTRQTQTDVNLNRFEGPAIYLPEQLPDPAKQIPLKRDEK